MGFMGVFALIVLTTLIATSIALVVWLAMLPGKIAFKREHSQAEAIRMAGWLGILTGIIWVLALIWAYTRPGADRRPDGENEYFSNLEKRLALIESREAVPAGDPS